MNNRRAFLFALVLGTISVMATWAYLSQREAFYKGQYERMPIFVAKRDIQRFEAIDESMLEIRNVPKPFVQPLAVSEPDKSMLLGMVADATIKEGEQLLKTKLSRLGESGISPLIPKGKRACTLSVNDISGVGGHIRNGDSVDIIGTFKIMDDNRRKAKDLHAVTIYQNIPVLAVGKNYLFDRNIGAADAKKAPLLAAKMASTGFSNVTLQMSPRDCMGLMLSQEVGSLSLMLRSYHDRFAGEEDEALKSNVSTIESVTGIQEKVEISQQPQWLEIRGEDARLTQ